jgi:hypothetical protein
MVRRSRCKGCGRLPKRGGIINTYWPDGSLKSDCHGSYPKGAKRPGEKYIPQQLKKATPEQLRNLFRKKAGCVDNANAAHIEGYGMRKRKRGGSSIWDEPGEYHAPAFAAVMPPGGSEWVYDKDDQGRVIGRHAEMPNGNKLAGPRKWTKAEIAARELNSKRKRREEVQSESEAEASTTSTTGWIPSRGTRGRAEERV